jgi:PAS domain S-box-containing protein
MTDHDMSKEQLLQELQSLRSRLARYEPQGDVPPNAMRGGAEHAGSAPSRQDQQAVLWNILAQIPCAVFWKDRDSVFLGCNENLARDCGLGTPEQVTGKTDYDTATTREQADFYVKCDREVMESGRPLLNIEETQQRPDGRLATLLTSKVPLHGADGSVVGLLGMYQDITERKRSEEALRESGERYRTLFEANPHPMWVFDVETQGFLAVNDAAVAHYGYSREEFLSLKSVDIRPAEDVPMFLDFIGKAPPGHRDAGTWRHRRKDGRIIDVEVASHELSFGGRRARLVLAHDVTERKRAEEALRASEQRYRLLFEGNVAGVVHATVGGRVLDCNEAFARMMGYPCRAEILTRDAAEFYHRPVDRQALLARLRERGELTNYELCLRRKDGEPVWVLGNLTLIDGHAPDPGIQGIYIDVTERRQLDEQLGHAQKMQAVGQLAGGIAHDFNNLLTVVLGNTSLILSELSPQAPERELLEAAERAALRAAEVTRQLLGFSRRALLRPRPTDLNAVVADAFRLFCRTIDPRIVTEVTVIPDLWRVQSDPGQMGQVLLNLCLNARDAMPEGGRLTVETANVVVGEAEGRRRLEARPGRFVRLRVTDTGCGMTEEVRARIFEPFFTTKGPGTGTGLGLAMVFGIVQQHQGWVECASEVGRGTRFDVFLPRSEHQPAAAPADTPSDLGTGRETILLADDEPAVRELGKVVLQRYGYQVLTAADGQEAVERYQREQGRIDLVILDLTMPRLSGRDAFRRLLAFDPGVRVLFASGHSAEQVTELDHERVLGFISKPYRSEELAQTVRRVLDIRRPAPPALTFAGR